MQTVWKVVIERKSHCHIPNSPKTPKVAQKNEIFTHLTSVLGHTLGPLFD